eukprot:94796_1
MAPIICDRVNEYALYALALHDMTHDIIHPDVAPLQLDCVIIPEMVRQAFSGKSPIKLNGYNSKVSEKRVYCKLSEEPTDVSELCIWNIEDLLTHPKSGYVKNRDYFVAYAPKLENTDALRSCLVDLVKKCLAVSAQRDGDTQRNRYTFIIDRRHPDNLKERTLKRQPTIHSGQQKHWKDKIYIIIPKQYRETRAKKDSRDRPRRKNSGNEQEIEEDPLCVCGNRLTKTKRDAITRNTKCHWCNELLTEGNEIWTCSKSNEYHNTPYVLCSDACEKERPEPYGKISSEWYILPESCLGLSKGNILFNPFTKENQPITMNDALGGYMFGLSYHILSLSNICAYWYHNTGGTVFQLSDIASGWPQWFDQVNGKKQNIQRHILEEIGRRKALPNSELKEFERNIDKCDQW